MNKKYNNKFAIYIIILLIIGLFLHYEMGFNFNSLIKEYYRNYDDHDDHHHNNHERHHHDHERHHNHLNYYRHHNYNPYKYSTRYNLIHSGYPSFTEDFTNYKEKYNITDKKYNELWDKYIKLKKHHDGEEFCGDNRCHIHGDNWNLSSKHNITVGN